MDKIYYKELIDKYFEGNITDDEIKELSDWIKNDRRLQSWWEEEFSKSDADIN
ncbi:MAG TPA: iron dicitrate transport regulator FecR, partial [Bacteroides xylanisolvens]|nr:iron dicitrate transport regulator FecR [Bacteroides xylanisolvens]